MAEQTPPEQRPAFSYQPTVPVTFPSPEQEACFLMRWKDWERFKRDFRRTPPRNAHFRDLAFCSLGIAIPVGLTAIANELLTLEVPVLLSAIFVCVAVLGVVISILCFAFNWKLGSRRSQHLEELLVEMSDVEPPREG